MFSFLKCFEMKRMGILALYQKESPSIKCQKKDTSQDRSCALGVRVLV